MGKVFLDLQLSSGIGSVLKNKILSIKNIRILSSILSKFCSIWDFSFWYGKYYRPIFSIESCTEKLTQKWSDLFWREVHNSDDLLSEKLFFPIVYRDLYAWLFHSYFSPKIHPNLIGRLASFRKIFDTMYSSDSEFDGFEFGPSESFLHRGII